MIGQGCCAGVGGEQVGLQRGPPDRRASSVRRYARLGSLSVDLGEQIAVPVEERAVDAGAASDGGHAGVVAVRDPPHWPPVDHGVLSGNWLWTAAHRQW